MPRAERHLLATREESSVLEHLIATLVVASISFAIRAVNARRSAQDRFVGWVVFVLSVGGYFTAGFTHWMLFPSSRAFMGLFTSASMGWVFGLVAGLSLGMFIWRYYRKEIEGEETE